MGGLSAWRQEEERQEGQMKFGRKQIAPAVLILGIVLFIVFWTVLRSGREEISSEERLERLQPAAVELQMPGGRGSGVVWSIEEGTVTVLTAAHVAGSLREGDTITVNGSQKTVAAGSYISEDFDLAFVRVEWENIPGTYCEAKWDTAAFDSLKEGDAIYMAGYREEAVLLEGKIRNHWIYMDDFGYHMLWGDMSGVESGASGSGVFDENGLLAGILCGGTEGGEIAVLPLSVILTEWKHIDIR